MNIDIDKLISELKAEKSKANKELRKYRSDVPSTEKSFLLGTWHAFDLLMTKLIALKNEQPEAITEDSHLRKHDVGRSAASEESIIKGNDFGESSGETSIVGQNEQTNKVCEHDFSNGWRCIHCGEIVDGVDLFT